ncbi:hypothetical protein [Halopiger aswanensis]|nr:hypothetical protein [Halopiger aswanensis]
MVQDLNAIRRLYLGNLPRKIPSRDSIVVLQNEQIDFKVEFDGIGPSGVKFLVNDEIAAAPSLHPAETEWMIEPTFRETGEFTFQIIVEGPASPAEMEKLASGDSEKMANVKESERINATWDIVVADPDELYQSTPERITELILTALGLYQAGELSYKSVKRVKRVLDEQLPEETVDDVEHELTTLDDFIESNEPEEDEQEDSNKELNRIANWSGYMIQKLQTRFRRD